MGCLHQHTEGVKFAAEVWARFNLVQVHGKSINQIMFKAEDV